MGLWQGCGRRQPNPLAALFDLCGADFWLHEASYRLPLGSERSMELRILRWKLECLLAGVEKDIRENCDQLIDGFE